MLRSEAAFFAVICAVWVVTVLGAWGVLPVAGLLTIGLYPFYGVCALAGWLAGNLYMARRRRGGVLPWRRLLMLYLLGPPGFLFLLRSMAAIEVQRGAPLVPFYGLGVYVIFFLVPVTLSATRTPPRKPRIGG